MKIVVTIFLLVLVGCTKRYGLPEQFIVPDEYRGVFTITVDPAGGISVPVTNGELVLCIPATGKVSISSSEFINGRHALSARYVSGKLLPPEHNATNVSLRVVKVSHETETVLFLIGTQKEADDAITKY